MSKAITIDIVEIAHLDLAYDHTRIHRPGRIVQMAESLIGVGQLLPIVVVAGEHPRFILIDGYQRVDAAKRAGLDTLQALIWPAKTVDALCRLLAEDGARQFDVFEQACLLRELKTTHDMTLQQIAARMGRHPSWVTRRLSLIDDLPQPIVDAVRCGKLSSWSASRVLAPLARANARHAAALVGSLDDHPVASRQLASFWQHYQKANRRVRKKMIADPVLFFKSLAAREADAQNKQVVDGPEGRFLRDIKTVKHILIRLERMAEQVWYPGQKTMEQRRLSTAVNDARSALDQLDSTMGRLIDANRSRAQHGNRLESRRPEYSPDCPDHENVAKDHPAYTSGQGCRQARPAQPV